VHLWQASVHQPFFFVFFFGLCPLAKKMIMNIVLDVTFWFSYETRAKDNNKCNIVFLELHKTTTNLSTHRCLVLVFLELQKMTMNRELIVIFWFFFPWLQKTTISQETCHHLMLIFLSCTR